MPKTEVIQVAISGFISAKANQKVEALKQRKQVEGKKMTKIETIEYMLLNFKDK